MTELSRVCAPESLEKLLTIAHEDAAALRVDLADVRRARRSVESSITSLDGYAPSDVAERQEEVCARRTSLQACRLAFARAEDSIRDKLESAMAEINKLENLALQNLRARQGAKASPGKLLAAGRKAS